MIDESTWFCNRTGRKLTATPTHSPFLMDETALFEEVSSVDFLGFSFGGRSYQAQLTEAIAKTKVSYKNQNDAIPLAKALTRARGVLHGCVT